MATLMVQPDLYGPSIPPISPISADFSPVISPADSPIPVYSIQQCSVQEPLQVSRISSSEQTSFRSSMQSRLDVSSEALNLNQISEEFEKLMCLILVLLSTVTPVLIRDGKCSIRCEFTCALSRESRRKKTAADDTSKSLQLWVQIGV